MSLFVLKSNIVPCNHEFVIKMDYMAIIEKIEEIIRFLGIVYNVETERVTMYNKAVESDYEEEVLNRNK